MQYKRFHLSVYQIYSIYNSTVGSHVSNYFYVVFQEGLLYDAERDVLAIAKFLVVTNRSLHQFSLSSVHLNRK